MLSKLLCSLAFTYAALTKNSWEIVQFEHSMLAFLGAEVQGDSQNFIEGFIA